jgi:TolA-binding protein
MIVVIFTSILSIFAAIIGCTFYYLTKKWISLHNLRSKMKTDPSDKVTNSLEIQNHKENKKMRNQNSTKNANDRISSLSNDQLHQQQERIKKEREKRRMQFCEHQSKGPHGLTVNKSSFF